MNKIEFLLAVEKMYASIERQIPRYMDNEEDRSISEGNVAICMIDKEGQVYGKMYGDNHIRRRSFFRIAWIKASQVWITKRKTGEFEELVFAGKLDDTPFGIERPDFIGWEGGQPIKLGDVDLAVGFSGFRGVNDLEIVVNAAQDAIASK
jgi:glc operon protein GlcG